MSSAGAIYSYDASFYLTNSVVYGNAKTYSGSSGYGAIYILGSSSHPVYVTNSILWNNTIPQTNILTELFSGITYSCVEGGAIGDGNISLNPMFLSPGTDDFSLQSTSLCIDRANGDVAPEYDYDGNPRYDEPSVPNTGYGIPDYTDMGAYEYQP